MNTYSACWNGAQGRKTMKHTTNWRERVGEFVFKIRLADVELQAVEEFEEALAEIKASDKDVIESIKTILPAKKEDEPSKAITNNRNDLFNLIRSGKGVRDGSAKDILSGVTEYESNKDRRQFSRKRRITYQDKLVYNLYGDNKMEITGRAIDHLAYKYEIELPSHRDLVKLA
jgi:hypothetical protein